LVVEHWARNCAQTGKTATDADTIARDHYSGRTPGGRTDSHGASLSQSLLPCDLRR